MMPDFKVRVTKKIEREVILEVSAMSAYDAEVFATQQKDDIDFDDYAHEHVEVDVEVEGPADE